MTSTDQPWHRMAPALGTDAEFAAVRTMLAECGFTQDRIFQRLGISGAAEYKSVWLGGGHRPPATDALDALILLLMDGDFVPVETLDRLLPPGAVAQLEALRLVGRDPHNPERIFAGCTVFPARGLLMASDRASAPDGELPAPSADMVYPAANEHSAMFVNTLPETPCDALLDLGTGSGIAALHGARFARHAWGTDIAERSVQFARFNQRLNGIDNATMGTGDLYAPVEGLTFDRIVSHPPYVPARKTQMIFRDGGEDGEGILRRIVEGLPQFLRPGGRFYTVVTAADCEGQDFEDRLRLWLGPATSEFDLVLVAFSLRNPKEVAVDSFLGGATTADDIRYRHEMWARRKTKFLFHGSVMMSRHDTPRPAFTQRVRRGQGFTQAHVEWLLQWGSNVRGGVPLDRLMALRPALSPHAELTVIHRVHNGQLAPEGFSLRATQPFHVERILPPWLAQLVAHCDGHTTWQQHLENARENGLVAPQTTPAEFLTALAPLVSQGLLWVAENPLP